MKKFFITTPIYYVNDRPHVGSAYTTLAADVLARFYRAKGSEVFFLTGTDEHGAKIAKAAEMAGFKSPKEFCDHQVKFFKSAWQKLNISYNYFVRTTDKRHEEYVKKFLLKLKTKNQIYQGEYKGLYCLGCEEFKDRKELVNGKCPLHNSEPIKISEKNYFFKLSSYQDKLLKIIERGEILVEPEERRNEILSFLKKEKLKDVSISREKVKWGIPLPWAKEQVAYVWVDALLNYLSAGKKFWPADIHIIGKDIIKFHAIIWLALLLATSNPLPKRIFAHGFFTLDGKKISKTFGNIIYIEDLLKEYETDVMRYVLLKEIPFGQDGDFKKEIIKERYEGDLANNLGNLIQRVITLIVQNFQGDLAKLESSSKNLKQFDVAPSWKKYEENLNKLQFHLVLELILKLSASLNRYIDKEKPWGLEKKKQAVVLGNCISVIREIKEMLLPFMPETAMKIDEYFKGPKIKKQKPLFPK